MLILNIYLGNTKMRSALALLIRMVWNGLFVNKGLIWLWSPKAVWEKLKVMLSMFYFYLSVRHELRNKSWLLRCLKVFDSLREFLKGHTQVGSVFQ